MPAAWCDVCRGWHDPDGVSAPKHLAHNLTIEVR